MYKQSILNIISFVRFLKLIYRLQARIIFYISYISGSSVIYICLSAFKCVQNCIFRCPKIILDPHCLIIRVFSFSMYWIRVF